MLGRAGLPQDQAIRRVIIQIVEHRRQHIGFRLADAAADAGQTVAIIGLLHIDGETANQFLAVLRPHHQAHRMRSIAQAAWRAVEGVAAAQRVLPVWESRADVLPGQAVMRLAQPLAVQQDLERTDAGARQHPTLDRQPAGDLLLDRIVHHLRRVELETKLRDAGGVLLGRRRLRCHDRRLRRGALEPDELDLVADVVQPVAYHDAYAMLAIGDVVQHFAEPEPGKPGHRNGGVFFADIGPRQTQLRVAQFLPAEIDTDAGDTDRAHRPAIDRQHSVRRQYGLVTVVMDIAPLVRRRLSLRRLRLRGAGLRRGLVDRRSDEHGQRCRRTRQRQRYRQR